MWCLLAYLLIIPLVGVTLLVTLFLVWSGSYWQRRGFPSAPVTLFWKCLFHGIFVTKSNGDADVAMYKKLDGKKYVGVWDMFGPGILIRDPELMKNIFVKDFDHFVDRMQFNFGKKYDYINLSLGNLMGKQWKDVRNVVTPTFTSSKIKRTFPSIHEICDQLKGHFDKFAENGEDVEVKDAYGRFTMDVIAASAFGVTCNSFQGEKAIFPKMASKLMFPKPSVFIMLIMNMLFPTFMNFLHATRFPLPSMDDAIQFFTDVTRATIAEREKSEVKRNDLLQMLLDAKKGELQEEEESDRVIGYSTDLKSLEERRALSKAILNERLIIAQCITFFIAGYESTANSLGFAAYELALHPDIQEELYAEIKRAVDKHKGQITYDAIMEMELLDKVFYETLRLHTPVFKVVRTCTKDYQIPGTDDVIPKGSMVIFPSFAIHRDETYFPNPMKFDPERFSPEEKAKRSPYLFQSFGHGPRNCVGMRFALMKAKAALATTILHYRLEPSAKTPVPMKYSLAGQLTQAKDGVWLKVVQRNE